MRNLYINGRFLSQQVTGVQRYAIELVSALDILLQKGILKSKFSDVCLITPNNCDFSLDLSFIKQRRVGKLTGHLWEQFELPFYSCDNFLVNFCNTGPLFKRKQIVTIHDAAVFAYPDGFTRSFRMLYQLLLPSLGRNSKWIITDSEFSKTELNRYCGIPKSKISSIHLGIEHILKSFADESVFDKHQLVDVPYILAVSSMNPNKNFSSIVRAMAMLGEVDYKIVIAGGGNLKIFGDAQTRLSASVKHVGYVTDAELHALYSRASCFVYPSLYEGFGLPPLEAMACGCPVIVSNAASLPEVCGSAAIYFDPCNPADIAEKINKIMTDNELQSEMRIKGLERTQQLTWEKCAAETWAVIEEALQD